MRVLYLTSFVLGDSGANAADIFPRLAAQNDAVDKVIVADFPKNKYHIEVRQGAEYLRLEWRRNWFRHAARIARKCKQDDIDVIHIFYRQQNAVLAILLRLWLIVLRCNTTIFMDHRSVNLARGWRSLRKKLLNLVMQTGVHHLGGNPWAVETNHFWVFRPKHLIDLGYDSLPDGATTHIEQGSETVNVWFIGSLKPRNRKSQFLIDIFEDLEQRRAQLPVNLAIHVAGPTHPEQAEALQAIKGVTYHGVMPRQNLYEKLRTCPGLGLAYMNHEFHEYAPSLKFAEYAIMRFRILSSETLGLKTQAERMALPRPARFIPETVDAWAQTISEEALNFTNLEPEWAEAAEWSYPAIFERQVMGLYRSLTPAQRRQGATWHHSQKSSSSNSATVIPSNSSTSP